MRSDFPDRAGDGTRDVGGNPGGATALDASQFKPVISLKALSYFGDGDLPGLSHEIQNLSSRAATAVHEIPVMPCQSDRIKPGKEHHRHAAQARRKYSS